MLRILIDTITSNLGFFTTVIAILLTSFSLYYAKSQSKKLSNNRRSELITLWASIERVWELFAQMDRIILDQNVLEKGILNQHLQKMLHEIHKGLKDEYVRIAQQITIKDQDISKEKIEKWVKIGKVKKGWQKDIFINLAL